MSEFRVLHPSIHPTQHFERLWTSEAAPFSEAYNSTLCAAVCKTSRVWPPCSAPVNWTLMPCIQNRQKMEHSRERHYCGLTYSMIHIFLWFIHRWDVTQRRDSVARQCETPCDQQHWLLLQTLISGFPDPQCTRTRANHPSLPCKHSWYQPCM